MNAFNVSFYVIESSRQRIEARERERERDEERKYYYTAFYFLKITDAL